MKNPSLEHFKTPCQTWKGVGKAISSKMEENRAFRKANRAFRKAKSSIWQGMPNLAASDPTSYSALLPTFHGWKVRTPILTSRSLKKCAIHSKKEELIDLMRLKLFPFTLKDKAKKFFPTHRTNGLKRQISNFSAKENEKFYECWERYMEAINACPHHGFDTWLLFQEDGMNEYQRCGRMKSQPNAKGGMYVLSEDMDMKAKFATMARRLEELELKKVQEVQAISVKPVQVCLVPYVSLMSTWWRSVQPFQHTYNSNWRNHPNFSWKPRPPQYTPPAQAPQQASNLEQAIVNLSKRMDEMQNDLSQKIDNVQYSISRLTNLNTVQEKGKFPSQPHQNPKGIHEVEAQEGESSKVREVKAVITLRSVRRLFNPHPS
ncbi:hypothetical protein CK203_051839 [Vitis vinifera]|uniref:Retrotransposon gag domain-containing protein n=1 Tax=Vitis vinifera TaxID=29760 RepID=A0A438GUN5_VITVI|nr:hypothetical protein CK203_051839 [Vitis vinifera]